MASRSYLTLLLLLNYLLVVGAGLVERPARVIDRPFAYEHSHDCQLQNTLRIGCFDDCNGVQYVVKKNGEPLPLQVLLSTLKGLDTHCLPQLPLAFVVQAWQRSEAQLAAREAAVPTGYRGQIELPPCRG
ncbi:hypothetical protein [Hymenobacter arizonensis]|uniref:Uncharacterized protein n=1 Tax=Hymenobacter arizonensis TaxID=1227077 RepID=A0A1I6AB82_HYMAR|nr:hypothetical protein [Hymenobacter arizonensis]SFQ65978.1 hypothetical protein SAMN04515668_3507 [Hymenobacter arizonensis]